MQRMKHLFCVVALAIVWGAHAPQTIASTAPIKRLVLTQQQWEKRVVSTADNPRNARKVILDAIYASTTIPIAMAYEKMYKARPSDVRLGTFGYAALIAQQYRLREDRNYEPTYNYAAALLQRKCAPEEGSAPRSQLARLKDSKDANAWLAWGVRLQEGVDIKERRKRIERR